MGAPPDPRTAHWKRSRDAALLDLVALAEKCGDVSSGHHNLNYRTSLPADTARLLGAPAAKQVTVRVRRGDALPVVIRTWQDEARILDAIRGLLPHVPECLAQGPGFAVHNYVEGVPLSSVCANDKPVDTLLIRALAGLLAQMAQVRRRSLPPLPSHWPGNDTDSQAFLKTLARLADVQIRQSNWPDFGGLFTALGIPEDALIRFGERVPAMARRPYSLLHADLHRDNLIVSYDGKPPLICVDWELATYGDPLHDLATHLVRMRYPSFQWDEVIDAWAEAMGRIRPQAVAGLAKDLRHYVDFERAQSVYPDVIRAVQALDGTSDQKSLDEATAGVHRALVAAEEPLRLRAVPGVPEIESILFRWRAARAAVSGDGRDREQETFGWEPDGRVAEHADFSHEAVTRALRAEGAAPAGRVFKGTAHLNSVVWVSGVDFPVVVRRKVANVCRREPRYLSEHAVLQAIEESKVAVAAPKALALGRSYQGEAFAVHTYVGPFAGSHDIDRPPLHPVDGLLPHEADGLVDQLCELTRVDYKQVDRTAGEGGFHTWLCDQLVVLVWDLPKESMQLARVLGLPDAHRLREILTRKAVTHREPALLHGDLNPWNLVRRDDRLALTIIDWEMALVGDPLYDLVRHLHLTRTRPEIRERMFRRWESVLPAEYTRDWRKDWPVYRWIEHVRSAYVDLDRLVTGESLDAPNVRRAVHSYPMTLATAMSSLGLPMPATLNPYLARALA
ncbi:aminoglycoside phosphotransferase family protein [Streptomyces cadmiisoli]|uniref:aminoglycoside phosphotransferase family protein n=1 Tax=Streptomyces cadmiisoli TaxID=2184053 RepID=UPI003660CEDC